MKRRVLATAVGHRFFPLLERFSKRPVLAVLAYHRILAPEGHPYDKDLIEATPDQFDEQMGMLRKRCSVAAPEEVLDLVAKPKTLRHFRVAITFDDGYRDNYTNAFSILKSHGLRAAFFLPTDFVGTRALPWWDRIAAIVRTTTRSELTLRYPRPLVVDVDRANPEPAIRAILRSYTRQPEVEVERFLAAVEEACGASLPREADERQFLSWEEAAEMKRAGMAMGSHSHRHFILANLSPEEQRTECRVSHEILREKNLSAEYLAYPVGNLRAFSATTVECARAAGYRIGFSNYGGVNLPAEMDPFDVRRLSMTRDEDARQLRFRLAWTGMRGRQPW